MENATYELVNEIFNAWNNGKLIGGIFCDLKKAFVVLIMIYYYPNWNFME
jgi:hypothetical protein